jgi:hypothetical protein
MKDNHTLANNPENAVRWCQIAMEEVVSIWIIWVLDTLPDHNQLVWYAPVLWAGSGCLTGPENVERTGWQRNYAAKMPAERFRRPHPSKRFRQQNPDLA